MVPTIVERPVYNTIIMSPEIEALTGTMKVAPAATALMANPDLTIRRDWWFERRV